jgi:glycosyltransferase 2 family protein
VRSSLGKLSCRVASHPEELSRVPVERQPSASPIDRLRQPATIASIVVPLSLLLIGIAALPGFHLDHVAGAIGRANPWLLGTGLAVYFASFPIRGERWRLLLRGAGMEVGPRDATEILFLSWFVNCLVPAKLGDVYRAYLLRWTPRRRAGPTSD